MTDGTKKILIVVTSHQEWSEAGRKTGYWIGEVSHFAEVVQDAGFEFDVVSPGRRRADGPQDYAAIYFAGGHGTMWDFPGNEALAKLAGRLYDGGGVVGAVCHGVAGLLDVQLADGSYLLNGHEVTGFANVEEKLMGLSSKVPYLTETKLKERGAKYRRGLPFTAHAVVDGRLVTGQNPGSTKKVAQEIVALLG